MSNQTAQGPDKIVARFEQHAIPLLPATGDIATSPLTTFPLYVGRFSLLQVYLDVTKLTRPGADEELDVYFQTSLDGDTWYDLENLHYAAAISASTPTVHEFGPATALVDPPITPTDGTLADNTRVDLSLGAFFRLKVVLTDAAGADAVYALSAVARGQS